MERRVERVLVDYIIIILAIAIAIGVNKTSYSYWIHGTVCHETLYSIHARAHTAGRTL